MTAQAVKVIAVCRSGFEIGMGHAVRLGAVLEALPETWPIDAFIDGKDTLTHFPSRTRFRGEIARLETELERRINATSPHEGHTIILADLLEPPAWLWQKGSDLTTVAISDRDWPAFSPDLLFNPSDVDGRVTYASRAKNAPCYSGLDYAPLRKAFYQDTTPKPPAQGISFIVGSSDRALKWIEDLIRNFSTEGLGPVRMVISSALNLCEETEALAHQNDIRLLQNLSDAEMHGIYTSSVLCIMTAGSAINEALSSGAAILSYPIQDDMHAETNYLSHKNAIVGLSRDDVEPHALRRKVDLLLQDRETLQALRDTARTIVDGLGAVRIAKSIEEHCI